MSQVTCPRSPLSRDLDLSISLSRPITEIATDMSLLCFCTPDLDFPPDNGRVRFYSSMPALEQDVAPNSAAWQAGYAFFSRSDRPARMALGRIFEAPTAASLTSGAIAPSDLTGIADGAFDMAINGADPVTIGPLNFATATTVADIATVVNNAITAKGVNVTSESTQLKLMTTQVGPQASLDYASPPPSVTDELQVSWLKGGAYTAPTTANGAFTLTMDGVSYNVSGMDFTGGAVVSQVITSALNTAGVNGVTVLVGGNVELIHSPDTRPHVMSVAAPVSGTDISSLLGLTAADGALNGTTVATSAEQFSTYTTGTVDMTALKAVTPASKLSVKLGDTVYESADIDYSTLTDIASLVTALTWTGTPPFTVAAEGETLKFTASNTATFTRPIAGDGTDAALTAALGLIPAAEKWTPHVPVQPVRIPYTDVSSLLKLSQATASGKIDGYTPSGLVSEVQIIEKALRCVNSSAYGWAIDAKYRETDAQKALAAWMETRPVIFGACTNSTLAFSASDTTSIVYYAFSNSLSRTFTFYHNNPQYYPEVSYLACALSVNYAAVDSTLTMKFKQLPGIPVVPITESELAVLEARRCNTYIAIGNTSATVRPGVQAAVSWFTDSRVNLDNYQEELQVEVYNVFLRNKKVPYTVTGQSLLVSAAAAVNNRYTRNGTFAPRDIQTTDNETGYVTYPATSITPVSIYLATISDRAARLAPPILITAYESGAMHKVNINVDVFE